MGICNYDTYFRCHLGYHNLSGIEIGRNCRRDEVDYKLVHESLMPSNVGGHV